MNVHSAPLGIFDSGLGGLSVVAEVRRLLPAERVLYVADSRFCPYGDRSPDEISTRSRLIAAELIERGAKVLVAACNTASAVALDDLRAMTDVPVIGVEPAVKPAAAIASNGKIGVLATARTAMSERLHRLIERYASDLEVHIVPAPELVSLVERGILSGPECTASVARYVRPLVDYRVKTIVLGCTHFPFLRPVIQRVAGSDVRLIDSGEAIARRIETLLPQTQGNDQLDTRGGVELLTTGEPNAVGPLAARLLGEELRSRKLTLAETGHESYPPAASPRAALAWAASTSAGA